jgi:RimJ/RimL family protein N-acetyltransferase
MLTIEPTILKYSHIQLESLHESHKSELHQIAQDKNIWNFNASKAFGEQFDRWFDKAINGFEQKQHLPYVVRRLSDHKIIGSTRFYDIQPDHRRLTIGYTWYIPEVWGTYVNPQCKLLLLTFAFENLQMNRVEFVTDSRNARSRAAIKKLGAVEEGVLRQHMVLEDGYVRDTVLFSIIKSDWLPVKSSLQSRVEKL